MTQELWQLFLQGLSSHGLLAVNPETFRAANGLAVADWEVMNYTGLNPATNLGSVIHSNLFAYADPIPNVSGIVYEAGPSLSDAYTMFLASLLAPADAACISEAILRSTQFQMSDSQSSWPGYKIQPGLNDFILASLQSVGQNKPPQIDFTISTATVASGTVSDDQPLSADSWPVGMGGPQLPPVEASPYFFSVDGKPIASVAPSSLDSIAVAAMSAIGIDNGVPPTVRFQVQCATMFSVQPDRWFQESLVNLFDKSINPASTLFGKTVFGPSGFLSGCASQILVGFKRTVSMQGEPDMITGFRSAANLANNDFNIGSFFFSPGAANTTINQASANTVVFQDNTNAPYVIGIGLEVFGP